ncbi:MAG: alginate lyase family protein [Proteobacteria bacterium]|nr:alginate lyase family protein [Pseudomonadota bacterium]
MLMACMVLLPAAAYAASASDDAAPVLVTPAEYAAMKREGPQAPLFVAEQRNLERTVRKAMAAGIVVPLPKDPGGGYTHEQHKRNYMAIQGAGTLYRLTGDRAYADYARDMLLAYARMYPKLGPHPAQRDNQIPGRLFWQILNDSVWLVYSIQGYDAIRDTLTPAQRATIDNDLLRPMARYLSDDTPKNFDQIHNHATWAVAAVGMTGYVLRDHALVDKALLGLSGKGQYGFLAQIDQLFSPDGYYEEGPYYQRYALGPFVIFAGAIQHNEPKRKIFQRRGGVLLKAVDALIQSSYDGYLFPFNDSLLDKGLDSEEIVTGVDVAYAQTQAPELLSIAKWQKRVMLTPEGLQVARALAAGKERPFAFRSILLRDGANGDRGAIAVLRSGGERGLALAMKNTSQGMGHGHFDRLSWVLYDHGERVVTDYGSARFINVEAKQGGIYLPENTSWAKQTVAHNALAVNERSQFDGEWRKGEATPPQQLLFAGEGDTQIAFARMDGAYPGVVFDRALAVLKHADLPQPVVVDLLRVHGSKVARYDLPLHFNGQIMAVGFDATRHVADRPVLGGKAGYQHLWVDAESAASADPRTLTWLIGTRFYTYRFGASAPTRALLVESGANDPDFNLRHEPALIQRMDGATDATFFGVLEPHGEYNGTAEYVHGADSRIQALRHARGSDADVIALTLTSGATIALGVADDPSPTRKHHVVLDGTSYDWTGGHARLDRAAPAQGGRKP